MEDNKVELRGSSSLKLHVAVFPWLAFGHIMPLVQLSNKLAAAGVKVTFISAPGNVPRTHASLKSPGDNPVDVVTVCLPPVDGLPPGVESTADTSSLAISELLKLAIEKMAPDIEALLSELRPHAVLYDYCYDWLPGVAGRLGIKALHISLVSAMCKAHNTAPARKPPGAPTPSVEDMRRPPPGLVSAELTTFQAENNLFIFKEFGGPSLYDRAVKCIAGATAVVIMINGCQLVLLPQRGDQIFNAMVVGRDMGAGVEVKRRDEDGYFGREDVFEAVEAVMGERAAEEEPGKRVRSNHKKWMEFFRDEQLHQRFMTSFVEKMKRVIFG